MNVKESLDENLVFSKGNNEIYILNRKKCLSSETKKIIPFLQLQK